jgi:hypothetical protein
MTGRPTSAWWTLHRVHYNLLLLAAGLACAVDYVAGFDALARRNPEGEITFITLGIQAVGFAITRSRRWPPT